MPSVETLEIVNEPVVIVESAKQQQGGVEAAGALTTIVDGEEEEAATPLTNKADLVTDTEQLAEAVGSASPSCEAVVMATANVEQQLETLSPVLSAAPMAVLRPQAKGFNPTPRLNANSECTTHYLPPSTQRPCPNGR